MVEPKSFHDVALPEDCTLRRKESFEYTTASHTFDVELFENQDTTCYAIAVPRDAKRLMVFGTQEVKTPAMALRALVDKIRREESLIDPESPLEPEISMDAADRTSTDPQIGDGD